MRSLFPVRGSQAHTLLKSLLDDFQEEERPCEQDPDLWWMTDHPSVMEAKKRCLGTISPNAQPCPLLEVCGMYATVAVEPAGVWGGMSPEDRLIMRRRLAKQRARAVKRKEKLDAIKNAKEAANEAAAATETEGEIAS